MTLVEYQIAEGEVLPGAVYSLPLELEFSGGSQMSVILQLTAIPSGTRLIVSGHTIEVFGADGQMISK